MVTYSQLGSICRLMLFILWHKDKVFRSRLVDGYFWYDDERLAIEMGCSTSTIKRARKILKDNGFIDVIPGKYEGKCTQYKILYRFKKEDLNEKKEVKEVSKLNPSNHQEVVKLQQEGVTLEPSACVRAVQNDTINKGINKGSYLNTLSMQSNTADTLISEAEECMYDSECPEDSPFDIENIEPIQASFCSSSSPADAGSNSGSTAFAYASAQKIIDSSPIIEDSNKGATLTSSNQSGTAVSSTKETEEYVYVPEFPENIPEASNYIEQPKLSYVRAKELYPDGRDFYQSCLNLYYWVYIIDGKEQYSLALSAYESDKKYSKYLKEYKSRPDPWDKPASASAPVMESLPIKKDAQNVQPHGLSWQEVTTETIAPRVEVKKLRTIEEICMEHPDAKRHNHGHICEAAWQDEMGQWSTEVCL